MESFSFFAVQKIIALTSAGILNSFVFSDNLSSANANFRTFDIVRYFKV